MKFNTPSGVPIEFAATPEEERIAAIPEGAPVRFRKSGEAEWRTGNRGIVWLCLDSFAVEVGGVTLYPEFGDEVEMV